MNIQILKQAARTTQQRASKGLATQEQAAAAQQAFDRAITQPQRDSEAIRRKAEDDRQQAIWDSVNDADTGELRRQATELERFAQLSEEPFDGTYRHLWIFKGCSQ